MPKISLPPLPRGPMFIGDIMSVEWQEFFRRLYERVGGYDEDLESASYLSMGDPVGGLESRVDDLEISIAQLTQSRGAEPEVDEFGFLALSQLGDRGFETRLITLESLPTIPDIVCHDGEVITHEGEVVYGA